MTRFCHKARLWHEKKTNHERIQMDANHTVSHDLKRILSKLAQNYVGLQMLNFGPANSELRQPNMSVLDGIRRVTVLNFQKSKNYSKTKVYKSQLSPTYSGSMR